MVFQRSHIDLRMGKQKQQEVEKFKYVIWLQFLSESQSILTINHTASSISIMKKQPIVCMTGFTDDPQQQLYKQKLSEINCKYVNQLSLGVTYLILKHTCTEKYKVFVMCLQIAQLPKSQVECVTIDWLNDSHKAKSILAAAKYRVPNIFYGVAVAIHGFEVEEMNKIKKVMEKNGAQVTEVKKMAELTSEFNAVITNSKVVHKLGPALAEDIKIPLVTMEWIEQSLRAKICKYPLDYSLNYLHLNTYPAVNNTNRLTRKYNSLLEVDFMHVNQATSILIEENSEQCIIYMDPSSIEPIFISLLKKLICLSGGMYLDANGPCVTHVLVGSITEAEFAGFLNHGNHVCVVRVEWLIDSILFSQRQAESDYKVRCFKQKNLSLTLTELSLQHIQNSRISQNISLNHNQSQMRSNPPALKRSKSISAPRQPMIPKVVKKKVSKSQIFRGKCFYIDKQQKKQTSMINMVMKIKENGGAVYDAPMKGSTLTYIVMCDSEQNPNILKSLSKVSTKEGDKIFNILPVSTRWIEYCIRKGEFLNPSSPNFFIFKPFSFRTPLRQLMTMKIELIGLEDIIKMRYRELLSTLGSAKISPNKFQITHCLCGSKVQEHPRYLQIKKENINAVFIRAQWLIDVMNDPQLVKNVSDYLIQ